MLAEVRRLVKHPEFDGNISDVGAPSANMYGLRGKDFSLCEKCRRQSCLFPTLCKNMDTDHSRLTALYKRIDEVKGVRHSYVGSGVRYDLFLGENGFRDASGEPYLKELMLRHTSGRLKVAPEHTEDKVLKYLGKPSFRIFTRLRTEFDRINREAGTHVGLVPYFISGHPGCKVADMEALSRNPALRGLYMDQVQDFTPTPMTASSVMYYTGLDPRTLEPVCVERDIERKRTQKSFFFKKSQKVARNLKKSPNIAPRNQTKKKHD